jgi:hypothetical protein
MDGSEEGVDQLALSPRSFDKSTMKQPPNIHGYVDRYY